MVSNKKCAFARKNLERQLTSDMPNMGAISRWESGIALPSTDNLKSLSALYGVPIDYLLNSDVEREDNQVQTDIHCGEQEIPQKKNKRKRVIVGFVILLLIAVIVLAFTKERSKRDIFIEEMEEERVDTSSEGDFHFDW